MASISVVTRYGSTTRSTLRAMNGTVIRYKHEIQGLGKAYGISPGRNMVPGFCLDRN